MSKRQSLYVLVAAAIITGAIFSPLGDQLFLFMVVLGPLLTGIAIGSLGRSWKSAAAPWALTGVFMLVYDWIANNEDQAFHVVLTFVMVGLVAVGAAIGRRAARRRLLAVRSGTVSSVASVDP